MSVQHSRCQAVKLMNVVAIGVNSAVRRLEAVKFFDSSGCRKSIAAVASTQHSTLSIPQGL